MKNKILLTLPLLAFASEQIQAREDEKPNIMFIFADDMSINGLGCINDEVITPNLDALRKDGVFFSHTFNQGAWNGAISVASRSMLITGKYLWTACSYNNSNKNFKNNGEWPVGVIPYAEERAQAGKHWSEYMKEAGYTTYFTGKWHIGTRRPEQIFDHVVNMRPGGMPDQVQSRYRRTFMENEPDTWFPYDTTNGGYWKGGKHWSEVLADDAISFIEKAEKDENPFFMYLAFNAPHDPRQSPKEYVDMYPLENISVPESFLQQYPYADKIGTGRRMRDELLAPYPRTEYAVKKNRQEYFALITHLDAQIGKIIKALKESGEWENTYIIFTADNGLAVGDHGFMGKQNMYDSSMRVPMIMVGPGIKEGLTVDKFVYLQDAMATAMDLAGSEHLDKVDFQSVLPLAQGKKMKTRDAVYGGYLGMQRMVRTDKYKMIIYPTINIVRLYDLVNDPNEVVDLAGDEKYRKVMDKLLVKLEKLQKEVKDPLTIRPYYDNFFNNLK